MDTEDEWRPALATGIRLQYETAQDSWVLLYPEGMAQLNASAAEILKRCDGSRTIAAMTQELEILFNTSGIEPEVQNLTQEARRRGWLV